MQNDRRDPGMRKLLASGVITATALTGMIAVDTAANASAAQAACRVAKHKQHYDCVTPGAYCAKAAKGKWGVSRYATRHQLQYKCVTKSGRLHWIKQ